MSEHGTPARLIDPATAAPVSSLAIAAAVAALVLPPVGIVLGIVAATTASRAGRRGTWLAVTAIVVGTLITVGTVAGLAVWVGVAGGWTTST
jgi:hypothetical protein